MLEKFNSLFGPIKIIITFGVGIFLFISRKIILYIHYL